MHEGGAGAGVRDYRDLGPGPLSLIKRDKRLILVSNRLPVVLRKDGEERWSVQPGSGGLVTALVPVLKERGETWIGWPGTAGESDEDLRQAVIEAGNRFGYTLKPVMLSPAEVACFYAGFANEVLWPLFHHLQSLCDFEPRYRQSYREVNGLHARHELASDPLAPGCVEREGPYECPAGPRAEGCKVASGSIRKRAPIEPCKL